jgi:maltooligosyltrehalose synthase
MAKAVEDTAFYRYHRLLALNEVGGAADGLGCTPESFHRRAADRLLHWPDTLLATATHDTKRGEDARARLAVLSEIPAEWEAAVAAWRRLNETISAIDPADEYAIYQSLVGAWPPELRPEDECGVATLSARLEEWLLKALREGKERSSWDEPDEFYEQRAIAFLHTALRGELRTAVTAFVERIDAAAIASSLGQLLAKLTTPGVPDIYQGTEFRDLSLVDPDNRRPVDFDLLNRLLIDTDNPAAAKLRILERALAFRARQPLLFARGDYRPLWAQGPLADHVVAFARVREGAIAITIITRLLGRELLNLPSPTLLTERWRDTTLPLPADWHMLSWRDLLGDSPVETDEGCLRLASLLGRMPVALLTAQAISSRALAPTWRSD